MKQDGLSRLCGTPSIICSAKSKGHTVDRCYTSLMSPWRLWATLACATVIMSLTGCGTIVSMREDWDYSGEDARPSKIIYSGVREDLHNCFEPGDCPFPGLFRTLMVMDLPFSACADTISLPYTIYRRLTENRRSWRVIDVVFESGGVRIVSLTKTEERNSSTLPEICSALRQINGKPQSVRVNVTAQTTVTVEDYGRLFETIQSNTTLRFAYQSSAINQISQEYLARRPSTKVPEDAARKLAVPMADIIVGSFTVALYCGSVGFVFGDVRRRQSRWAWCLLGVLLGAVGSLIWLVVRPPRATA